MEIKMTRDIHIQGESDKSLPYFSQKQLEKKIPIIKMVRQVEIYTGYFEEMNVFVFHIANYNFPFFN